MFCYSVPISVCLPQIFLAIPSHGTQTPLRRQLKWWFGRTKKSLNNNLGWLNCPDTVQVFVCGVQTSTVHTPCISLILFWWSTHLTTKMYRCSFWMKHYGCKSPKRTRLWSWSWAVSIFNQGKLAKKNRKATIKTAIVYWDKKGIRRYKGSRALKGTQLLSHENWQSCFFPTNQGFLIGSICAPTIWPWQPLAPAHVAQDLHACICSCSPSI